MIPAWGRPLIPFQTLIYTKALVVALLNNPYSWVTLLGMLTI